MFRLSIEPAKPVSNPNEPTTRPTHFAIQVASFEVYFSYLVVNWSRSMVNSSSGKLGLHETESRKVFRFFVRNSLHFNISLNLFHFFSRHIFSTVACGTHQRHPAADQFATHFLSVFEPVQRITTNILSLNLLH